MVKKYGRHIIGRIPESQIDSVIQKDSIFVSFFIRDWEDYDAEKQERLLLKVIDKVPINLIWPNTKQEVQKRNILNILKTFERDSSVFVSILFNTDKEIQGEIVDELLSRYKETYIDEEKVKLSDIWFALKDDIKRDKFDQVLKIYRDNDYDVRMFWNYTPPEVQRKHVEVFKEELNKAYLLDFFLKAATDGEVLIKCYPEIFKKETDNEIPQHIKERIEKLYEKNHSICKEIEIGFLCDDEIFEDYDEEKILRMANYSRVQSFMIHAYQTDVMSELTKYIINNDENWVISIDRLIQNQYTYGDLISSFEYKELDIKEEFIQQLISILMDKNDYFCVMKEKSDNFFDYINYMKNMDLSVIEEYFEKRNETCLKLLRGEEIDENILKRIQENAVHNKGDLQKFALLEYKFGIDLEEARRLIQRYGMDSQELPDGEIKDFLTVLKDIVECENIEEVVRLAIKENTLDDPWNGFPNARNIEGKIINLFTDLYNETFYNPLDEKNRKDKSAEQEVYYIEKEDGTKEEHKIDMYYLKDDFNMSVRVEGAFVKFEEPSNFKDYYNLPDLLCHGNCQSYIGNDLIATAPNTNSIIVAYDMIGKNNLTSLAPYDITSRNRDFSIFNEKSEYRTPQNVKDHTRHPHNEMVKERIITDKNGNVKKLEPSYIVWIEEDTKEERSKIDWKENRENDSKWIMTKKAAAQLGVPIVVIDREYYAERETEKIETMKKLLLRDKVDDAGFLEEFNNLSKPELIKEIITKFENNATGMQFNNSLKSKFFTQEQMNDLISDIEKVIETAEGEEKKECICTLIDVAEKESRESENKKEFYDNIYKKQRTNLAIMENESVPKLSEDDIENLSEYIGKITDTDFYDECTVHSIEHIQKVMLFANVLAKGEGLSKEDTKILLMASALHDCARDGNDGNVPHAKQSAEKAGTLLAFHKELFGDVTNEKIAIIQTAIHYHESDEFTLGKIEYKQIEKLLDKYGELNDGEKIDLDRTAKICELLKDADALDRLRFSNNGRLDRDYLRSETAKKQLVVNYAEDINEKVAEKRLVDLYGVKKDSVEPGKAVKTLKKVRNPNVIMSRINGKEYVEPKFLAEEFMEIVENVNDKIENNDVQEQKSDEKGRKKDLYMLYFKSGVTHDDCKNAEAKINEKEDTKQEKQNLSEK